MGGGSVNKFRPYRVYTGNELTAINKEEDENWYLQNEKDSHNEPKGREWASNERKSARTLPSYPFSNTKYGFVYLLRSRRIYKIGTTRNMRSRFKGINLDLARADKNSATIEHYFVAKDGEKTEKFLHEHFSDKRITGEWFELDASEVEYVKSFGNELGELK